MILEDIAPWLALSVALLFTPTVQRLQAIFLLVTVAAVGGILVWHLMAK